MNMNQATGIEGQINLGLGFNPINTQKISADIPVKASSKVAPAPVIEIHKTLPLIGKKCRVSKRPTEEGIVYFLRCFWYLVTDPDTDHLIRWDENEINKFIVEDENALDNFLKTYEGFRTSFNSFRRSLYFYGFKKFRTVWFHKDLDKNDRMSLKSIKRKSAKKSKSAKLRDQYMKMMVAHMKNMAAQNEYMKATFGTSAYGYHGSSGDSSLGNTTVPELVVSPENMEAMYAVEQGMQQHYATMMDLPHPEMVVNMEHPGAYQMVPNGENMDLVSSSAVMHHQMGEYPALVPMEMPPHMMNAMQDPNQGMPGMSNMVMQDPNQGIANMAMQNPNQVNAAGAHTEMQMAAMVGYDPSVQMSEYANNIALPPQISMPQMNQTHVYPQAPSMQIQ